MFHITYYLNYNLFIITIKLLLLLYIRRAAGQLVVAGLGNDIVMYAGVDIYIYIYIYTHTNKYIYIYIYNIYIYK